MNDPIVDEVRRVRSEHAARFNYDLWAIFRDIQEQQKRSGLTFVSFTEDASAAESKPLAGAGPDNAPPLTGPASAVSGSVSN